LVWVGRLWRLVFAVWLVPVALALPVSRAVSAVVTVDVGASPAAETEAVLRALAEHGRWLGSVMALLAAAGWAWSVLWHAGAAEWAARSGGARATLGGVIGCGVSLWVRQAVVGVTGLVVSGLAVAAAWVPMLVIGSRAWSLGRERTVELLVVAAVAVPVVVALLSTAAMARATWAVPHAAASQLVLLWPRAAVATVRQLPASLATVVVWAVPAVATVVAVATVAWFRSELVTGLGLTVLEQLAGLIRACCVVGLLGSFAPPGALVTPSGAAGFEGDADASRARPC
jgi:hypothetical protein